MVHITPSGRWVGTVVMCENNARYLAEYTDFPVALTRLSLDDDQGALEGTRTETRRTDGQRHSVDDAIVFVVRVGKIAYWHEYFDTAAFAYRHRGPASNSVPGTIVLVLCWHPQAIARDYSQG